MEKEGKLDYRRPRNGDRAVNVIQSSSGKPAAMFGDVKPVHRQVRRAALEAASPGPRPSGAEAIRKVDAPGRGRRVGAVHAAGGFRP
ncbi:MAG TPA: hypothetical protein VN887_09545, partial [Candidatus Angelobacter sp.]|nr:hypothetical protein [Candidatus Angelobacter sp.]